MTDWARLAASISPSTSAKTLEDAFNRVQNRWAAVTQNPAAFARAVAESGVDLNATYLEDWYLTRAALDGDAAGMQTLWTQISAAAEAARRIDGTPVFLQEVRQALGERMMSASPSGPRKLELYRADVPLLAWLRVAAVRVAINLKEGTRPSQEITPPDEAKLISQWNPELLVLENQHQVLFKSAFASALARLPAREQVLLKSYYVDGATMEELGGLYGKNKSTISRWLDSARDALFNLTRQELQQRSGARGDELESLLNVAYSQVSLNLSSLLRRMADSQQ